MRVCLPVVQPIIDRELAIIFAQQQRDAHHPLLLPTGPATKSAIYPSQQRKRAKAIYMWFLCLVSSLRLNPYNAREFHTTRERGFVLPCRSGMLPVRCLFFLSRPSPRQRHALPPPAAPHTHADLSPRPESEERGRWVVASGQYHIELISCADS